MAKNPTTDKVIIATVAAIIPLIVSGIVIYFSSIPSEAQVKDNTNKITKVEKKIEKVEKKVEKVEKEITNKIAEQNVKIQAVDSKVNRVLSGLCIIEPKTCSLKNKPD